MNSQLDSGWPKVKLGAIASLKTGKLNSNAAKADGLYPFFTCSQEVFRTDTYSFDTEGVLLAGNNANGIYPIHYYRGKFDAYQRTYVIRSIDENRLTNRYLYYSMHLKLDVLRSISTGAATKFLTLTILNDLDIDLPPAPIQRKIAAILSVYDDLIANNTRRIKILEEMARTINSEWFLKFHFPGHDKVKMVGSELGAVPEGWNSVELGEIAGRRLEKFSEKQHAALPLLDMSRIPRRSCAVSDFGNSDEIKTSRIIFEAGDVLFGAIRPYFHKVAFAPTRGVTNVSVLVLRPSKGISPTFLFALLFSDETVSWANQHSGGTKMPVIGWDVFRKMRVVIAPPGIMEAFDGVVSPMLCHITSLVLRNMNLRRTRDLLLLKLISGKLDVENLDIAVPESTSETAPIAPTTV
jgi:type I restriction enzyme, S subunit